MPDLEINKSLDWLYSLDALIIFLDPVTGKKNYKVHTCWDMSEE